MAIIPSTAKVVELHPKEGQQSSEKKWGKSVIDLGFSIIPSLIFRAQARLGLSPVQLVLLLHLADYWWQKERMPHPSKATLAERMKLSTRQIQRHLTDLEKAGFIQRKTRFATHKGQLNNEYNLTGLVKRLQKLEPEFTEVKELKKTVAKPGGLASKKKNVEQDE